MKLALNYSFEKLNKNNFDFAKQIGCDGLICHLNTYDSSWGGESSSKTTMTPNNPVWEYESLIELKRRINDSKLDWYGIENFNPFDWYDILLDGPKKVEQLSNVKRIISNIGKAGIRYLGYNFSLSAVYGRVKKRVARGNAETMTFNSSDITCDIPIQRGMVWNTQIEDPKTGFEVPIISNGELWERCKYFLTEVIPVAEDNGVIMAAHPDDPPLPRLRRNARLIHTPDDFIKLTELFPSENNKIDLCIGTLSEMKDSVNLQSEIKTLCEKRCVGYIHLRNVKGKVDNYLETFMDDGDINIFETIKTLKTVGYDGPIVPDHTPY